MAEYPLDPTGDSTPSAGGPAAGGGRLRRRFRVPFLVSLVVGVAAAGLSACGWTDRGTVPGVALRARAVDEPVDLGLPVGVDLALLSGWNRNTVALSIDGDEATVIDGRSIQAVAPGGRYAVSRALGTDVDTFEVIDLDRQRIVAEFDAASWTFLPDGRLALTGTGSDFTFRGMDLLDPRTGQATTVPVRADHQLRPMGLLTGDLFACEEDEVDPGSGVTCVGYVSIDPTTGAVVDHGQDVATVAKVETVAGHVWTSARAGDQIVDWIGTGPENEAPLRAGDRTGTTAFADVQALAATPDGTRVVAASGIGIVGPRTLTVCRVADLVCDPVLPIQRWHRDPDAGPSDLVGVVHLPPNA